MDFTYSKWKTGCHVMRFYEHRDEQSYGVLCLRDENCDGQDKKLPKDRLAPKI